ncbi:MAG: AAA family ATPase [Desulfovibrio sp.]|nr:AAA family ATPase [Desulfovibrio sp.]
MPAARILIGGESFRRIREENCYYIDKTGLIEKLLSHNPPMVSLFTRPRRFGKTLNMTMLRDFLDIRQDSREIFAGLSVSENRSLCDAWMNQHPVLFISLKYLEGTRFEHALGQFQEVISRQCIDTAYLLQSEHIDPSEKEKLSLLKNGTGDLRLLENSLLTLCRALHAHWGKPAILLIDEYDVPLARAEQKGYYEQMVSFLRNLLGAALKTNMSLQFAVLTGCLRIARESIFTGLNNFRCYGISEPDFADSFGFTAQEVDALLAHTGFSDRKELMREWYDGYSFGSVQGIYCPWDILLYVDDLQSHPDARPRTYWSNTSSNSIVRTFIGRTDLNISDKFEALINGMCVQARIVETLTYDSLHSSEDNLWSILYLTGYLTSASEAQIAACGITPLPGKTCLRIPNREVREIFMESIAAWFTDSMLEMDRTPLFTAFWNGDAADFMRRLSRILLTTISYHDYREDFYHAVLTGIFVGSGYAVASNRESGLGRADIIIKDQKNARAAVIEVKHSRTAAQLPQLSEDALSQIKAQDYAAPLQGLYEEITLWGMAFFQKRCMVRAEKAVAMQPF